MGDCVTGIKDDGSIVKRWCYVVGCMLLLLFLLGNHKGLENKQYCFCHLCITD